MTPAAPRPLPLVCDDAPVSTIETMTEVHARLRTRRQVGEPRWDPREIARSTLGELSDRARAEFLADMLCELRGGAARQLLCEARNRITIHLYALITAEYDAEVEANPGADFAHLAGRERPSPAAGLFNADEARAIRNQRGKVSDLFAKNTLELRGAAVAGIELVDQRHDLGCNQSLTGVSRVAEGGNGDGPNEGSLLVTRDASEG